ncbi:hypothetical protein F5876DRAFT_31863 [Lentinula aff. lateritia]|uniref:Uncharacterized protein n=1 Tax=Lentinula aff. lateritia TaxID=2804960 RepID=A0ACC1UD09_9AGAR|nr:hypothetical protein F5876DRAFT_31863 [Lentinula aff. lateritia]
MTSGFGTSLHAHFHLRNQQAFQRLLASNNASAGAADGASSRGIGFGSSPRSLKSKVGRDEDRIDINARDGLGRTVLHLASASTDASSVEYVRLLLRHPELNINLQDRESQWTALHRAMYIGNLGVVLLLLQHSNTDTTLKDLEGYTAFDLYNSTIEGTKPEPSLFPATSTISSLQSAGGAELFTWGANRNASLGHGDSSDRTFPDPVPVPRIVLKSPDHVPVEDRFARVAVLQVKMGRLHTAVISNSPTPIGSGSTLSLCGFGSGGRLGVTQHTQYALRPLSWAANLQAPSTPAKASTQFRVKVIAVALGQDHTLALTENGEIYSWGLNRFSQLGYSIDDGSGAAHVTDSTISSNGEQIQLIPRRVYGPLKKEFVLGVAASKGASACWVREGTDGASGGSNVYTWGLNGGQLGYDRTATGSGAQVQSLPRKVTKITRPVVQIALGESAMACLLSGIGSVGGGWKGDVLVFWGDQVGRVSFPIHTFPLSITPYRPPQALKSTRISANVNQNNINFACVSEGGEVFTFGVPGVPPLGVLSSGSALAKIIKPQRVWALRRGLVGAVRDVAIGGDGSLIVCTDSGHVHVRARSSDTIFGGGSKSSSGGGKSKFARIPYLQRIVGVCASSTGAFGALRVDADIRPINWPTVDEELFTKKVDSSDVSPDPNSPSISVPPKTGAMSSVHQTKPDDDADENDDDGDLSIKQDIKLLYELCAFVRRQETNIGSLEKLPYGADLIVYINLEPSLSVPIHAVLLGARSNTMASALLSPSESVFKCHVDARTVALSKTISVSSIHGNAIALRSITFTNFHSLAVLILLHYIYTDELICIWDRRVSTGIPSLSSLEALEVTPTLATQVKSELQNLAKTLVLPEMLKAMESVVKRPVTETLRTDLATVWNLDNSSSPLPTLHTSSALAPDIFIQLAEGHELFAHSTILRTRSVYFDDFLSGEDWTKKRRGHGGVLKVDLRHVKSNVMEYVMKWLCCGQTEGLFGSLEFAESVDTVLEFLFEVIAVANELILFPLVLLASQLILKFLSIHNACYILSEASHYHAYELVTSVESYISENLETFLETHMLEALDPSIIKHLSSYIRSRQENKASIVRSNILVKHAMSKWQEWLENEDIPTVFVPSAGSHRRQRERKLSQVATFTSPPSTSPVLSTSFGHQKDLSRNMPPSPISRPRTTASPGPKPHAPIPESDDLFDMDDVDISLPSVDLVESRVPTAQSSGSSPAWKSSSVPRVDMRSVMAEAAGVSESQPPRSTQFYMAAQVRDSPNDGSTTYSVRLRRAGSTFDLPSTPSPSPRPSGSSWKVTTGSAPGSGSATPNAFPTLGGSTTPVSKSRDPAAPPNGRLPPQATSSSSNTGPTLGPIFSPSRQPAPKAPAIAPRRVSYSTPKAWVSTPVHEPLPPSITNSNLKGVSFVAIQQLQLEQGTSNINDKRSLLEIQQEEQAKREEEDFLKWWNAEEERVRLETEAIERLQSGDKGRQGSKGQHQKNQQKRSKKGKTPNVVRDTGNSSEGPSGSAISPSRPSRDVNLTQSVSGPSPSPRRPRGKRGPPAPNGPP